MAVYNVVMGQGITVADLGNDTLITGPGEIGDSIQSCSAVMFFNTGTRAAGLFHFPSGNILADGVSRNVLTAMRDAVQPTEGYIAYGVVDWMNPENRVVPSDPHASELRTFVLGLLPMTCRLRRMPARTRIASISQAGNAAVIGDANPEGLTELRGFGAGNYAHYTLYGSAL
jgi:hypothetical protein